MISYPSSSTRPSTRLITLSYFSVSIEDLVFPVQPSTGSPPTLLADRSVSRSMERCLLLLLTNVLLGSPIHYNDFQRGPRT